MKSFLLLLAGLAAGFQNSSVTTLFSDNPIWVIFDDQIETNVLQFIDAFEQSKVFFDLSKPLKEFCSSCVHENVNYLVFIDEVERLAALMDKLKSHQNYNPKLKHLLVGEQKLERKDLEGCFRILWGQDVYNAAILTLNDTSVVTWFPYSKRSNCGRNINIKRNSAAPFSNKIPRVFRNCPIKVMWKKFLFITTNPDAKPLGVINQILDILSRKMGLVLDFERQENEIVLQEHHNRTPIVRLTKYVVQNKIGVIANMYGPSIALFMDNRLELSTTLSLSKEMWLLPRRQRLPIIQAFISALTPQEYFYISIALIIFFFVWHLAFSNAVSVSVVDVIRIFLQQPVPRVPGNSRRLLLIFGLFFAIHIGYLYCSQLIRVLYRPFYPAPFKTLEEVLEKTQWKFDCPPHAAAIQRNKNETIWRMMQARNNADQNERNTFSVELKMQMLNPKNVVQIAHYDLYNVHNPQDLEILEEQVRFIAFLVTHLSQLVST